MCAWRGTGRCPLGLIRSVSSSLVHYNDSSVAKVDGQEGEGAHPCRAACEGRPSALYLLAAVVTPLMAACLMAGASGGGDGGRCGVPLRLTAPRGRAALLAPILRRQSWASAKVLKNCLAKQRDGAAYQSPMIIFVSANILCIGKISIWRRGEAGVTPVVAARLQRDPYIEGNPRGGADPQSPPPLRLLPLLLLPLPRRCGFVS